MQSYKNSRPSIPAELEREIKVVCGHACAVQHCGEHTYLEIHHIDGNRENNTLANLVLLCDKHHKMAHNGVIDRKDLRSYLAIRDNRSEISKESLGKLLGEILGATIAGELMSGLRGTVHVVLNPNTVDELTPFVNSGLLKLESSHSTCSLGAGNRVGNDFEDLKRAFGIGHGYFMSCADES